MPVVTLSAKGQVAIPKEIQEALHLKRGAKLSLHVENGALIMKPIREKPWQKWKGFLKGTGALRELEREHAEEVACD